MNDAMEMLARKSVGAFLKAEGDFVDPETGFLTCAVCGEPKRAVETLPNGTSFERGRECRCDRQSRETQERERRRKAAADKRRECFGAEQTKRAGFTFEASDGENPEAFAMLRRYCDGFKEYAKDGAGLLLYSTKNGGGKTFAACCVANRLVDDRYSVRVTDLLSLRDALFKNSDKNAFLRDLCARWSLVVLDDVGAESDNEATVEAAFRIVDALTDAGVPLVVTTNLTPKELAEHSNRAKRRVYDRILGSCVPIKIDPPNGASRRLANCRRLMEDFEKISPEAN